MEEGDVNLPSVEGIFRQILYGNEYFQKDFGKASTEYMLPDCFGFPASLPSILAHAAVRGFSTQKLNRKLAAGRDGWWSRLARTDPGRHSVQRWNVDRTRWKRCDRGIESGSIRQQGPQRYQRATIIGVDS